MKKFYSLVKRPLGKVSFLPLLIVAVGVAGCGKDISKPAVDNAPVSADSAAANPQAAKPDAEEAAVSTSAPKENAASPVSSTPTFNTDVALGEVTEALAKNVYEKYPLSGIVKLQDGNQAILAVPVSKYYLPKPAKPAKLSFDYAMREDSWVKSTGAEFHIYLELPDGKCWEVFKDTLNPSANPEARKSKHAEVDIDMPQAKRIWFITLPGTHNSNECDYCLWYNVKLMELDTATQEAKAEAAKPTPISNAATETPAAEASKQNTTETPVPEAPKQNATETPVSEAAQENKKSDLGVKSEAKEVSQKSQANGGKKSKRNKKKSQ